MDRSGTHFSVWNRWRGSKESVIRPLSNELTTSTSFIYNLICYHNSQCALGAPPVRGKGLSHHSVNLITTSFQPVIADSGNNERRI